MKLYRDLQEGETLQAGDEAFRGGNDWASVVAELYGLTPSDVPWGLFRRPVDLPMLTPVTPEAMAEPEPAWLTRLAKGDATMSPFAATEIACEVRKLLVYQRAMEAMAAQVICPKTTAQELAEQILKKGP